MPNTGSELLIKRIIYRMREKFSVVWMILEFAESWFEQLLLHLECLFSQNTLYLLVYLHISYHFTWVQE